MIELKKQFCKQLCIRWDELLLLLITELFAFALGEIILKIVVGVAGENDEFFEAGVLAACISIAVMIAFISCNVLSICFNLAIGMCSTRKSFVSAYLLVTWLEFWAMAGTAYLLHHLELWILRAMYPGLRNEFDMGVIFQWKYMLITGLALVAANLAIGTFFLRFGKISIIIIWAFWMLACHGWPRLFHSFYHNTEDGKTYGLTLGTVTITENIVLAGVAGVSMVLIFISWLMLRKQQVKM